MIKLNYKLRSYFLLLLTIVTYVTSETGSKFKDGDIVDVYVNKVGPYWNPHETYHYYSLPVCRPSKIEHKSLTLGEVLDGDRMAKSMYKIEFKKNVDSVKLCSVELNSNDLINLQSAIEDLYYFEFVTDNIPMRGFIGQLEEGNLLPHTHNTYIYTHYDFYFEYNNNQIIFANVSTKERAPSKLDGIMAPIELTFTYSVTWEQTKYYFNLFFN